MSLPNAEGAIEVEFVAASDRTQALVTLSADDLRHIDDRDLISVRGLVVRQPVFDKWFWDRHNGYRD